MAVFEAFQDHAEIKGLRGQFARCKTRRDQGVTNMFGKVLKDQEKAAQRLRWAQVEVERAQAAAEAAKPSEHAIRLAAYLCHCADLCIAPSHQGALRAGFPCTGAALATALNDALAFRWVGQQANGELYWRDAGLSDECPLIIWTKLHKP